MAGKRSAIYGAVVNAKGDAAPVTVETLPTIIRDKGGYEPELLDPVIEVRPVLTSSP